MVDAARHLHLVYWRMHHIWASLRSHEIVIKSIRWLYLQVRNIKLGNLNSSMPMLLAIAKWTMDDFKDY